MAPDDDNPAPPSLDPKVKELLERDQGKSLEQIVDEKTAAELQRWFGLPSFEKLEEEGVPPPEVVSPEDAADQAKRDETLAAVADWMMNGLTARHQTAWDLIIFKPEIDVRIDVDMPLFDQTVLSRISINAETREVQRPQDIEDELKNQTPQALLRDLHRSEEHFEKQLEINEGVASLVVNPSVECRTAMATSWKLPNLGAPPGVVVRQIFAQLQADIHIPWADLPNRVDMTNRRVTE